MKERLHDKVEESDRSSRVLVLSGLGGTGKSSLALNYLLSFRKDYSGVFWLHAGSDGSLRSDCEKIVDLLYASGGKPTGTTPAQAIKHWFHGCDGRYLWILDSADSVGQIGSAGTRGLDVELYLPDASCVDVIITTRIQSMEHVTELAAIRVEALGLIEARELFALRAGVSITAANTSDIDAITRRLSYLALAVKLAGAYVSEHPHLKSRLRDYLVEYGRGCRAMLDRRPRRYIDRYDDSVFRAWETSCAAIQARCPEAISLLGLIAFLDHDDIEPWLFDSTPEQPVVWSQEDPRTARTIVFSEHEAARPYLQPDLDCNEFPGSQRAMVLTKIPEGASRPSRLHDHVKIHEYVPQDTTHTRLLGKINYADSRHQTKESMTERCLPTSSKQQLAQPFKFPSRGAIPDAFATLVDYSFLQWNQETCAYRMHDLVYTWSYERLTDIEKLFSSTAVKLMLEKRLLDKRDKSSSEAVLNSEDVSLAGHFSTCIAGLLENRHVTEADRKMVIKRYGCVATKIVKRCTDGRVFTKAPALLGVRFEQQRRPATSATMIWRGN